MARNRVQFQKGYSLTQFMDEYGSGGEVHTGAVFVGVGRTGSFVPDASTPGTGVIKAGRCISAAGAGTRTR